MIHIVLALSSGPVGSPVSSPVSSIELSKSFESGDNVDSLFLIIIAGVALLMILGMIIVFFVEVIRRNRAPEEAPEIARVPAPRRDAQPIAPVPAPRPRRVPEQMREEAPAPAPERTAVDMYVAWCAARLAGTEAEVSAEREKLETKLVTATEALRESTARAFDLDLVHGTLTKFRETCALELAARFDACVARDEVARFDITRTGWCIVTTTLFMKAGKARHRLGKLELHIGSGGHVRIWNQTRRAFVEGIHYDHPLVVDGLPLLTPVVAVAVAQAVATHNPVVALDALLAFVTEVPEETLVPAREWPEEVRASEKMA